MQSEEPKTIKICKQCKQEFKAWKLTLEFCGEQCEMIFNDIEDLKYLRFSERLYSAANGLPKPKFFGRITPEQATFEKKALRIKLRAKEFSIANKPVETIIQLPMASDKQAEKNTLAYSKKLSNAIKRLKSFRKDRFIKLFASL